MATKKHKGHKMDVGGFTDLKIMNAVSRILLFLLFTSLAVQSEEFQINPVTSEDKAFFEQIKKSGVFR
jgi:hypothetical protein